MEGKGVKRILRRLAADGLTLHGIIHDNNDASTFSNAQKICGAEVKEYLDINHYVKTKKQKLLALAKDIPDFEGYAYRIAQSLRRTMKKSDGNIDYFVKRMDAYYLHYQGNHTKCDHIAQKVDPTLRHIRPDIAEKYLKPMIDEIKADAPKLVYGYSSNRAEALNSLIAK